MKKILGLIIGISSLMFLLTNGCDSPEQEELKITKNGYFEMQGLNVLVFNNSYSEGHQGGIEIIQHGNRVATGGNMRLSPAPGQWQPVPMLGEGFQKIGCSPQQIGLMSRIVDTLNNTISLNCSYPDEGRKEKGFNPIIYPDIEFKYNISVTASGNSFTINVDLEKPLPEEWIGKVGYNLEFFPGDLYGKSYNMDGKTGIFPRQANGPVYKNDKDEAEAVPLANGNKLVIAPESNLQRITLESTGNELMLLDGSLKHNNGWFVVRTLIPGNVTKGAVQWTITPNVIPYWESEPVIHFSQVGYHPEERKIAYLELDKNSIHKQQMYLLKIEANGEMTTVKRKEPVHWGQYLRYAYYTFDFSDVKEEGMYCLKYGHDNSSKPFIISSDVFDRNVWEPTLEYFLPVQMCHMRVNQKYRVWHGACHLDDAMMAPENIAHFDGYNNQDEKAIKTGFKPLDHVPGLNVGGWHDAGDYDLRIESQAETVSALALIYEEFGIDYDVTFIDEKNRHVEIHQPDGKPDLLQQVEHGVLSILAGYKQFGQLYRGIIVPTLRQYVHLGDGSTQTDNKVFDDKALKAKANKVTGVWYKKVANRYSGIFDPEMFLEMIEVYAPEMDDRLVFTSANAFFQIHGAKALAIASRVLKDYNPQLSVECLKTAEDLYKKFSNAEGEFFFPLYMQKISTLSELILTTQKQDYINELIGLSDKLENTFGWTGWSVGRVLPIVNNEKFTESARLAALKFKEELDSITGSTPFGVPLEHVEMLGFRQYFLHKSWPDIFSMDNLFDAINYIFGCKPGNTTSSLISGVGVESPVVAYGANRADWSYIPGGTFWNAVNLVSPDYAEDKVWPYLWQEREYIITSPCYHMFSVIAAKKYLDGIQ